MLAYFCKYVLFLFSPRPRPFTFDCFRHLSTLIGIIARAVLFPLDGQLVRIYLTNPIADVAWEKLLTYWFKLAKWELAHNSASASKLQNGGSWEFDQERDLSQLCDLLKPHIEGGLKETSSAQAIFGLLANIGGGNGLFEIYYLKRERSYGVLRADSPGLDVVESERAVQDHNADWERIDVQNTLTNVYMAKNYTPHFTILDVGPGLPSTPEGYETAVRTLEHGTQVVKAILVKFDAPPNSPQTGDQGGNITEFSTRSMVIEHSSMYGQETNDSTAIHEENNIMPVSEENNTLSVPEENSILSVAEEHNTPSVPEENNWSIPDTYKGKWRVKL